jgi:hypothetical protein
MITNLAPRNSINYVEVSSPEISVNRLCAFWRLEGRGLFFACSGF